MDLLRVAKKASFLVMGLLVIVKGWRSIDVAEDVEGYGLSNKVIGKTSRGNWTVES